MVLYSSCGVFEAARDLDDNFDPAPLLGRLLVEEAVEISFRILFHQDALQISCSHET